MTDPVELPRIVPMAPPAPGSTFAEWIRSLIFWAIFLGIIGFSLYHYLNQNQALWQKIRGLRVVRGLVAAWRGLWRWIRGVNQNIAQGVEAGWKRLVARRSGGSPRPSWGFTSLRRMSPRQRVLFFYLAMLRRGRENGLPRNPSQTPYEYAGRLRSQLTEVDSDVDSITDEFVEARYSRHEISLEHANIVQQLWRRIKRAMRAALE
jgi:hypothetical protein